MLIRVATVVASLTSSLLSIEFRWQAAYSETDEVKELFKIAFPISRCYVYLTFGYFGETGLGVKLGGLGVRLGGLGVRLGGLGMRLGGLKGQGALLCE